MRLLIVFDQRIFKNDLMNTSQISNDAQSHIAIFDHDEFDLINVKKFIVDIRFRFSLIDVIHCDHIDDFWTWDLLNFSNDEFDFLTQFFQFDFLKFKKTNQIQQSNSIDFFQMTNSFNTIQSKNWTVSIRVDFYVKNLNFVFLIRFYSYNVKK